MIKEQALKLAGSKFWEGMSYRERALFQLNERLLCMPFDIFHEAVEKALGRPVFTHEFASGGCDRMIEELTGKREKPTFEEIINLIPEDKRVIIITQ